jgi:putative transposase
VGVVGYVGMPDQLHALLRPIRSGLWSLFLQPWKRLTSNSIQDFLGLGTERDSTPFGSRIRDGQGKIHVWQKRYYPFNVYTPKKAVEKLEYMHNNPVRAGLVHDPCAWPWSTAAYFLLGNPCPVTLCPMDGPIVFTSPIEQAARKKRLSVAAQPR